MVIKYKDPKFQRFLNSVNAVNENEFTPSFPDHFMTLCNNPYTHQEDIIEFLTENPLAVEREFMDPFLTLVTTCTQARFVPNHYRNYYSSSIQKSEDKDGNEMLPYDSYMDLLHQYAVEAKFTEENWFDIWGLRDSEHALYSQSSISLKYLRNKVPISDTAVPAFMESVNIHDKIPFGMNRINSEEIQQFLRKEFINGRNIRHDIIASIVRENTMTIEQQVEFLNVNPASNCSIFVRLLGDRLEPEVFVEILKTGKMSRAIVNEILSMDSRKSFGAILNLNRMKQSAYVQDNDIDIDELMFENVERFFTDKDIQVTQTMLAKIYFPASSYFEGVYVGRLHYLAAKAGVHNTFENVVNNPGFMDEVRRELGDTLGQDMSLIPADWVLKMWLQAYPDVKIFEEKDAVLSF